MLIAENKAHLEMLARMLERRGSRVSVYLTSDTLLYGQPDSCFFRPQKSKSFWARLFAS